MARLRCPKTLLRPRRWASLAALRRADVTFWLAGSGIFSDTRGLTIDRFWPLFRMMRTISRRFIFLSASAGPITHPRTPAFIRAIASRADAIGTRDDTSRNLMRGICADMEDSVVPMSDMGAGSGTCRRQRTELAAARSIVIHTNALPGRLHPGLFPDST